jgi:hypothetical protein
VRAGRFVGGTVIVLMTTSCSGVCACPAAVAPTTSPECHSAQMLTETAVQSYHSKYVYWPAPNDWNLLISGGFIRSKPVVRKCAIRFDGSGDVTIGR